MNDTKCIYCADTLSADRLEALQVLGVNPTMYSCLKCAKDTEIFIKGQFLGETGVSDLILVDRVDQFKLIYGGDMGK